MVLADAVYSAEATVFFFSDTPPTEIYTLSLHDALPISKDSVRCAPPGRHLPKCAASSAPVTSGAAGVRQSGTPDRKSTRLNSSHGYISYAVFCWKKKTWA